MPEIHSDREKPSGLIQPSFALRASEVAETDESITRANTHSPGLSRRYPRFSPDTGSATCTHVPFPPRTIERFVQSSARRCMYMSRMLWSNPRDINLATQALLTPGQVARSAALLPCRPIAVGGPSNLVRPMSSSHRVSAGLATRTIQSACRHPESCVTGHLIDPRCSLWRASPECRFRGGRVERQAVCASARGRAATERLPHGARAGCCPSPQPRCSSMR